MSSNLQVAADFTLVRGRFPWSLWGNVGPRRNGCLTCSQNEPMSGIFAVNNRLHSMKSGNTNFHPLWAMVEESDAVLVVICWHSGCDGISLLPDYWTEILEKLLQKSTLYEIWYFGLTLQENAGDCFGGLEDKEVDLQFSTWQEADLLPANSGKSFILTSNGTKSDFTGFDLPAEFGDDRAPRKPVVQIHKVNKHKNPTEQSRNILAVLPQGTRWSWPWIITFFLHIQRVLPHKSVLRRKLLVAL